MKIENATVLVTGAIAASDWHSHASCSPAGAHNV